MPARRTPPCARPARRSIWTPGAVRVVGRLDSIWIPVSNFELVPVVAVADDRPRLTAQAEEVAELVEFPLQLLLSADGGIGEEITVPGAVLMTGVYRWEGHRVWGATARTLAMLGSALSGRRPSAGS